MLIGARNLNQSCRATRLPITKDILNNLVNAVKKLGLGLYKTVMVRAMYLLAFHAFLRIGEMSATRSGTTQHILQLSDVEFVSEKQSEVSKLIITFRTYNHSKLTSPFKLEISNNHDTKPCPVHTLQKYVSLRSSLQGNLFIFSDNCPVTSNYFSDILTSVYSYVVWIRKFTSRTPFAWVLQQLLLQMGTARHKLPAWGGGILSHSENI